MDKSNKQTWTVVCFQEEGTVEAVPTSWISGDLCHFPATTSDKIAAAIMKNDPVEKDWPTHRIKTFRNGTYDDYSVARHKSKIAEDTSDLNSDKEGSLSHKRKRIKRVFSDAESSDDSDISTFQKTNLPPPPIFNQSTPKSQSKKKLETTNEHEKARISETVSASKDATLSQIAGPSTSDTDYSFDLESTIIPDQNQLCNNTCNRCCKQFETICNRRLREVTSQCHIIRTVVTDILRETKRNQITVTADHSNPISPPTFYEVSGLNFPLDTVEDLDKFEEFLNVPEQFELAAREISRTGGDTSYEFIKRSLTPILTNVLAEKFNWEGKKKKKKFSDLKLSTLILEADRRAKISKTSKECEKSIISWLKRAKERQDRTQKKFAILD